MLRWVHAEGANLQKGMNFGIGKGYAIFLMSVRKNAPYADAIDEETGDLLYEGHDEPRGERCPDPKAVDQPLKNSNGTLTENGKFFQAAEDYKAEIRKKPLLIKVYEKIAKGIWCYKGFFEMTDAEIVPSGKRKVCKFHLKPVQKTLLGGVKELSHTRLIPTTVKIEVWKRDGGRCVLCGSTENLHYDHDIPFSKGGSSLTAANVKLLCLKHNLEKSDKILVFLPWVLVGTEAASRFR